MSNDGFFFQTLRPSGSGSQVGDWNGATSYTNIDDGVIQPAYSGPSGSAFSDYIEAWQSTGDDEETRGYQITDPTAAYWWWRIAKLDVWALYSATGALKSGFRLNVSRVVGATRNPWTSSATAPQVPEGDLIDDGSWNWYHYEFFFITDLTKSTIGNEWTYSEWTREYVNNIEIEITAPEFDAAGAKFRVAAMYADLYVWPSTGGIGG